MLRKKPLLHPKCLLIITQTPLLKLVTMKMKAVKRAYHRLAHQKSMKHLMKSTLKPLLKNPRNISTLSKKETTSWNNIRWNSKLNSAETGSCTVNVNSKINAPSLTESTSLWKRLIFLRTTRQRHAFSSILHLIALMEKDANFCTLNMIS